MKRLHDTLPPKKNDGHILSSTILQKLGISPSQKVIKLAFNNGTQQFQLNPIKEEGARKKAPPTSLKLQGTILESKGLQANQRYAERKNETPINAVVSSAANLAAMLEVELLNETGSDDHYEELPTDAENAV